MEILMSIVAGILFMAATYLMLSKSLLRIIIGTGLLSHGAHLLILTMGGLKKEQLLCSAKRHPPMSIRCRRH